MRSPTPWLVAFLCLWLVDAPARAGGPLRLAVMDFTAAAVSDEYAALGKGLQSMITTDLAQVAALSLVERARLKDIEAELKLGKSGAVDKASAARLGKLAGASHLLTGNFTVVGKKMRIDCHLTSVETGTLVLADMVEGDKEIFFELEKDLVKKLVSALGVSVAPRERAAVAKIHTADFEAFRRFSQSVDLFDAKRYEEAVATLRDAAARDGEFKLASYTLAQYETLLSSLREKAQKVESAQIDRRFLEQQQKAKQELAVMDRLADIARQKRSDPFTRAVALGALLSLQSGASSSRLRRVEDQFALARAADATAQQYWPLLERLYPELPLQIARGTLFTGRDPKLRLDELEDLTLFDKAFAQVVELAKQHWPARPHSEHLMQEYTWKAIDDFDAAARRLTLDARGKAELGATLYALGQKHVPDKSGWSNRALEHVAQAYRAVLDFDKSTAAFARLASQSDDAALMKKVADEIARNRDAELALAKLRPNAEAREYLMCSFSPDTAARLFPNDTLEKEARRQLHRCRSWPGERYLILGGSPVWGMGNGLWSGARSDPWRTEELIYFEDFKKAESDTLALWGSPRQDLSMSFELAYESDSFYGYLDQGKRGMQPDVALVFGVRDVAVELRDEATRALVRPTRAFALRLTPNEVQLTEARMGERDGPHSAARAFAHTVRERAPLTPPTGTRHQVQVDIRDSGIDVRIDGSRVHFNAPKERSGFFGFAMRGLGLASIRGVKLSN